MGFDGEQQIDEYGRCTLHPDMQLQHCTSSGEWRELLTVCPLCASGLPPTATATGGRHSRSSTPQIQQAAVGGDDQTRTQIAAGDGGEFPEEIEGFIMSSRSETIGSTTASGRDKKHKSKKKHHGSSYTHTPGIGVDDATGESQPRSTSRNRTCEAAGRGTSNTSSKAKARRSKNGNDCKRGLSSSAPELYNSSHSQAEISLQSIPTVTDGTIEEEFNGVDTLTIYDEDVSHQHSWGELQTTENFQSHVQNSEQRQAMYQEVYCREIQPPMPQQMHEPSTIPNHLTTDPQHRGNASTPDKLQKRPDPQDIGELKQLHHNMPATFYPHAAPPSPPTVPRANMSPLPWNGGERQPIQNPNQHSEYQMESDFTHHDKPMPKVLEQDEVSVMTMSSVTQHMHQLHIQRQQQRQAERHRQQQLEDVESDDESSSSSSTASTDSDYNNNSSKVPSVKSTALTSKVSSDMRSVSTKSVSSTTADRGGKINTCDYDDRGWCRRHPTTVHLRKKNLFRSTWTVLLSHCPECCLDEMKRVRDVQQQSRKKGGEGAVRSKNSYVSSSGRSISGETSGSHASSSSRSRGRRSGAGGEGNKSSHKSKEKKKTSSSKTNKNPPISQLHLRATKSSGDPTDDTRSVGTASTVTISSHTQSTGGRLQSSLSSGSPSGPANDIRGDYANNMIVEHSGDDDNDDDGGATAHVTRMPYFDKYGSHGWYTGQVDPSTGTPHGIGTMNYANGAVCYSEWNFGMSVNPPNEVQEEPFLMGGGGGYSSYPRQPRHHHGSYRSPMGHGGRSYLATLTEDGATSDYEYNDPPTQQHQQQQQQQQQSAVVCGMEWTDESGNTGSYTGEVNFLSIPHGMGSMRYDHGSVSEGMWRNGAIMGSNDSNSEKYRSSSSSPSSASSSSSSSSTASTERERRGGGGGDNYFNGSVSLGY